MLNILDTKTYTHTFENGASIVIGMVPYTSMNTEVKRKQIEKELPIELEDTRFTAGLLLGHLADIQFIGELPSQEDKLWATQFKSVFEAGLLKLLKTGKYAKVYEMIGDLEILPFFDMLIDAYTKTRRQVPKASEELTVGAANRAEEDADFLPEGEA